MRHRTARSAVLLPALLASLATLDGCIYVDVTDSGGSWWGWSDGSHGVSLTSLSGQDLDYTSRRVEQRFPVEPGQAVRLANIAGEVELAMGEANEVLVEATIYAEGQNAADTERLLDSMQWRVHKHDGHDQHWLAPPFESLEAIHYPAMTNGELNTKVAGRKVSIRSDRSAKAPTLFANLKITYPRSADLHVRNTAGHVRGNSLAGTLSVDTGVGDVSIATFNGALDVDTGSGDMKLGTVEGHLSADTGSGTVSVESVVGPCTIDTGSGEIEIGRAVSEKVVVDTGSGDITIGGGEIGSLDADTGSGDIEVNGNEFESFVGDTGSGDVTITSSLARATRITVDTGSGDVRIRGGQNAAFDLVVDVSSGRVSVGYADAEIRRDGREIIGARRGSAKTLIKVETGSGDCTISPRA